MATETLLPTADVAVQWSNDEGSSNYQNVDRTSGTDSGPNYVSWIGTYLDVLSLANGSGTGTISSITIHTRARIESTNTFRSYIRSGGTDIYGASHTAQTTWTNYTDTYTVNPGTSAAWTWSQVNALEIGYEGVTSGYFVYTEVSRCYIVVTTEDAVTTKPYVWLFKVW